MEETSLIEYPKTIFIYSNIEIATYDHSYKQKNKKNRLQILISIKGNNT